jgi:hypothetical protein
MFLLNYCNAYRSRAEFQFGTSRLFPQRCSLCTGIQSTGEGEIHLLYFLSDNQIDNSKLTLSCNSSFQVSEFWKSFYCKKTFQICSDISNIGSKVLIRIGRKLFSDTQHFLPILSNFVTVNASSPALLPTVSESPVKILRLLIFKENVIPKAFHYLVNHQDVSVTHQRIRCSHNIGIALIKFQRSFLWDDLLPNGLNLITPGASTAKSFLIHHNVMSKKVRSNRISRPFRLFCRYFLYPSL